MPSSPELDPSSGDQPKEAEESREEDIIIEMGESKPENVLAAIEDSIERLENRLGQLSPDERDAIMDWPRNLQDTIFSWRKEWEGNEDFRKKLVELEGRFEGVLERFQVDKVSFQIKDREEQGEK